MIWMPKIKKQVQQGLDFTKSDREALASIRD